MKTEEQLKIEKKISAHRHLDKVRTNGPVVHAKRSDVKTLCNRTITYSMLVGGEKVTCDNCKITMRLG